MQVLDQKMYQKSQSVMPFAVTDVLTEYCGEHQHPLLHFWQLEDTMILGMKDTRVTDLNSGFKSLVGHGYQPVIRNAGGLGVISDVGVLNISLIIPKEKEMTTDSAYEAMVDLMRQAFPEVTIETGEVADSYCPGTYDLSIDSRKIAGIAQRRIKQGVAIMLYLSVFGDQDYRGAVVRDFYQAGLPGAFGTDGYPPVRPASMITLSEKYPQPLTIQQVKERVLRAAGAHEPAHDSAQWLQAHNENQRLAEKLQGMLRRNQPVEEFINDSL